MSNKIIAIAYVVLISGSPTAIGHGDGASLEKNVGDFLVDIGYSEKKIIAGESIRFDFGLNNTTTNESVDFDNIFVRINRGEKTLLAGAVYKNLFNKGITYTFPSSGDYELYVRFQKDTESIVETSFPLQIVEDGSAAGSKSNSMAYLITAGLIGLILGLGISKFSRK